MTWERMLLLAELLDEWVEWGGQEATLDRHVAPWLSTTIRLDAQRLRLEVAKQAEAVGR